MEESYSAGCSRDIHPSEEVPPCYLTDLDETEVYDVCNGGTITVNVHNERYAPGISLDKTGPSTAMPGDTIKYYLTVTNTGNIPLEVYSDDPTLNISDRYLGTYQPGASNLVEVEYEVPGDASGSIENTAKVTGRYECPSENGSGEGSVEATDSHIVEIVHEFVPEPSISLVKSGPSTARPGQTIKYKFKVTNTEHRSVLRQGDPIPGLARIGRN